jgi:three-Cys-motif partner protein
MSEEHFDELKEWSARKHELLVGYLGGFVKILGSLNPQVYYVDGFAGPGLYEDGNKGSPTLAAEHAHSLIGKNYGLHCINVELMPDYFKNLQQNTAAYSQVVQNLPGAFGDQVDQVLRLIRQQPTIFFLDPFGLKGIEWRHLAKLGQRASITEVLMRVNPTDLQRLAGFWHSVDSGAMAKCQLVTDYLGFSSQDQWLNVWHAGGAEGLINLYMERLRQYFRFVYRYAISSIDGDLKYYLLFATRHEKGAVLMNDNVCLRQADYQRDVREYKDRRGGAVSFFGAIDPTSEEIAADRANRLKAELQKRFNGQSQLRHAMRAALLDDHFGKFNKSDFTLALKDLQKVGSVSLAGTPGDENTRVTFKRL